MPRKELVPRRDMSFNKFQERLYEIVQPNLTVWGIPVDEFNALTSYKTSWDDKWNIGKDKAKRNSVDVLSKNQARASYEKALRKFIAQWLAHNNKITDAERISMEIHVRKKTRTASHAPDTKPSVFLRPSSNNQITITYRHESGEEGVTHILAKPEGVSRMEFCYKIGGTPPANAEECNITVSISRQPYKLNLSHADTGKKLYAFARWMNPRNEPGQWTSMLTIMIP